MDNVINNWYLYIATISVVILAAMTIHQFLKKPTMEQYNQVKEWILYAVIEAEKTLGSKTGQIKLRMVWDMFLERFPHISPFVTFEMFSSWVDNALVKMRNMIESNKAVAEYIIEDTVTFEE